MIGVQGAFMNDKPRLDEFDIAKGIAILCVILGHLGVWNITRIVYVFHMPIFFLISGYFLSLKTSFSAFICDKFRRLFIPYFATCFSICVLSVPMSYFMQESIVHNLWKWICGSLYGAGLGDIPIVIGGISPFIGALWFLPAIFWGMVITRKIIDLNYNTQITLGICIILFYVGWKTAESIWLPMDIQAGMVSVLFIYMGYLMRQKNILGQKLSYCLYIFLGGGNSLGY